MNSQIPRLELTFQTVAGSPWEGQAIASFQGEPGPPFPVREHLTQADRSSLRWYVEDYPCSALDRLQAERAHRIEAALEDYGRTLWQSIQDVPQVREWLGTVMGARKGRLELRAQTADDQVAFRSPWELMRVGGGTLLHQLGVTVVRRPVADLPRLGFPDTGAGLRVLAIVCRPDDTGFLDPRYTPAAILEALEHRPEVSIDFCRPGTLQALIRALETAQDEGRPYHVVHFDGHGTTIPSEGGIGALCFEKDDHSLDLVRSTKFGDLMARFRIPLAVLEACRTSTQHFAQETVATALLRKGVGTVVGMGHSVHVDMTKILMEGFYQAVARGKTLGEALQAGRNEVYAKATRRLGAGPEGETLELQDWFVPQLYQGADDPALLPREPSKPAARGAKRSAPVWAGFPEPPRAGFQGRALALHKLERAVAAHPVVVLHAPGGMGKTALAREAAHWWTKTKLFPDGAVFVSLDRTPSPEAVVNQVGQALEGEKFLRRKSAEKWLEQELKRRRLLIVWDNFESVLPAFNGGAPMPEELRALAERWTKKGSRVLLTSRDGEVGLRAFPAGLAPLSVPEGLFLLVRLLERLGLDRPAREEQGWTAGALEPVVAAAGGHALALELVAPFILKLGPGRVARELEALLAEAEQAHTEERNRSMWASLQFSMRHLSEGARAALPAVGLMAGGCLETMAPGIVGVDEAGWRKLRSELERVGLVRVEGGLLRPHPVLGQVKGLAPEPGVLSRFADVVLGFCAVFDELARSEHALSAMVAMAGSEGVVRRAIALAVESGEVDRAARMAYALKLFLQLSGRGREGLTLIEGVDGQLGSRGGELTEAGVALELQAAMARAGSDPAGALRTLEMLLAQLEGGGLGWDTRLQRALTQGDIARIHVTITGQVARALGPLEEAERLLLELEADGEIDSTCRTAVLGDRAGALLGLGRMDESLAAAEQGLELVRARGDRSWVARGLVQIASILFASGRHEEADVQYQQAIREAEIVGDHETLGLAWQHLGNLAAECRRPKDASVWLRRAFEAFQRAGDTVNQRRVLNSLGNVDWLRGDPEAAIAWYDRSLELAIRVGDIGGQATARANRALIRSKQAGKADDPATRHRLLHDAIAEEREALELWHMLGQSPFLAATHSNLAVDLLLAGQLEEAHEHALKSEALRVQMRDPDLWQSLSILEKIARVGGDLRAAEDYRRRREEAQAEAERLAGAPLLPLELVVQLLRDAVKARVRRVPLDQVLAANGAPEGFLAQLEPLAPWLPAHLQALSEGRSRPAGPVPPSFTEVVDQAWAAT